MRKSNRRHNDFDAIVVSELEILRESERSLDRLYSDLRREPHLRELFLSNLTALRQRTERLYAVLNPYDALEACIMAAPSRRPAA